MVASSAETVVSEDGRNIGHIDYQKRGDMTGNVGPHLECDDWPSTIDGIDSATFWKIDEIIDRSAQADSRGAELEDSSAPRLGSPDSIEMDRALRLGQVTVTNVVTQQQRNAWAVETHKKVRLTGIPNHLGAKIPVKTKLNIPFLEGRLHNYHDRVIVEFLKYGWPVGAIGDIPDIPPSRNHRSALQFPDQIDRYINKELQRGSLFGPFEDNPFESNIVVNPMGTVEKQGTDDRRVIMDLSFPRGKSVNSCIPKGEYMGESFSLKYPTVDSLVELVKRKGRGCALFKRDLKSAYRQLLPVDPGDLPYLGHRWKKGLYFDGTLPMGLSSSAGCCQRTTEAVVYIYTEDGYAAVVLLDDMASAEGWDRVDEADEALGQLLKLCGIEENAMKHCIKNTRMIFLGVMFDTWALTLSVTPERLTEILGLLEEWGNRGRASKKEVQRLIGKLNFIASCVRPGRVFMSRMLTCLRSMPEQGTVKLSTSFIKDVLWWQKFLPLYNGISMMAIEDWLEPDQVFASDACLKGCGAWYGRERKFFHTIFPEFILDENLHINALELLTICIACKAWGREWKGLRIQVLCDNEVSVTVINTGRSRDPFLQSCLRELAFTAACCEFEIRSTHITGVENRVPDYLSRWSLQEEFEDKFWCSVGSKPTTETYIYPGLFEFSHDW